MAWSLPPTFVDGIGLTAAQLNLIRDCLSETAAAKATTSGAYYVGAGVNTLAERQIQSAFTNTTDTTNSTSYGDLDSSSGPAITATTGTGAMLFYSAGANNNTVNGQSIMTCEVTGASTISPGVTAALLVTSALANIGNAGSYAMYHPLTAGSNTFTLKYRVSAGTGSFSNRRLIVMPF